MVWRLFRRLFPGGAGFHPAGHGAGHLFAGAGVRAPVFRLRALFHHRGTGRRGRAAALFLGRGVGGGWRSYWLVSGAAVALAGLVSAALVDSNTDVGAAANTDPGITAKAGAPATP